MNLSVDLLTWAKTLQKDEQFLLKRMAKKTEKWSWPKDRVSTFFADIEKKTPKAKALLVVNACRILCDSIGCRFLSDMKVFWLSYCAGTMVLIYLTLAIYTVSYNTYHHNFSHGIKATCVVGVAVPVSIYVYIQTFFLKIRLYILLFNDPSRVYYCISIQ